MAEGRVAAAVRLARALLLGGNGLVAVLAAATMRTDLGERLHHDVAYVGLAVATVLLWPLLRRRRVATLVMASAGTWSMLTGILLVYWTPSAGGGRWVGWWHAATSAAFFLAFLAHLWRNSPRLVQLGRRLAERRAAAAAFAVAWVAAGVHLTGSWTRPGRAARSSYADAYLSDLTTGGFVVAAVVLALAAGAAWSARGRAFLRRSDARNRVRGALDASLLVAMLFATVTGFAVFYATRPLRAADGYWIVVAWHTIGSVALLAFLLAHAAFNRRPLVAHTR